MQSVTVDLINADALKLLQDLEALHLIRLRYSQDADTAKVNWEVKYKGALASQKQNEVDAQLAELRNEWD
jgi:hypothetical protein